MRSVAIAALLIAVAIAVVTAVSFSSFGPSSETQVTPFESSTVIVTQDVPANCGSVLQTFRQGNFGM
ncbi:MAG TPA: hypothetical protein VJN71_04255, partial [Nitrososphaerales archaeon]|nr:hypothetical protein [Nitrososphaerales archaeon]